MEQPKIRAVLGPVWTHWGFKYWKLHLYEHAIIAFPYTIWESFMVALRLYVGRYSPDPRDARDDLVSTGSYVGPPGRRFKTRRYEISLVKQIVMLSSHMRNKVRIEKRSGEEHTYEIPIRPDTDLYRVKLRELYPDIYEERDFPTSRLGRLMKR